MHLVSRHQRASCTSSDDDAPAHAVPPASGGRGSSRALAAPALLLLLLAVAVGLLVIGQRTRQGEQCQGERGSCRRPSAHAYVRLIAPASCVVYRPRGVSVDTAQKRLSAELDAGWGGGRLGGRIVTDYGRRQPPSGQPAHHLVRLLHLAAVRLYCIQVAATRLQ